MTEADLIESVGPNPTPEELAGYETAVRLAEEKLADTERSRSERAHYHQRCRERVRTLQDEARGATTAKKNAEESLGRELIFGSPSLSESAKQIVELKAIEDLHGLALLSLGFEVQSSVLEVLRGDVDRQDAVVESITAQARFRIAQRLILCAGLTAFEGRVELTGGATSQIVTLAGEAAATATLLRRQLEEAEAKQEAMLHSVTGR